jgi:nitrite transporter NirC
MPVPIPEAVEESAGLARTKAKQVGNLPRYLLNSALAGAYVGVAVVLLASTAGPLAAAASPATKLVSGAVFGVALTLVIFAGAELFTGNVMFMLQGLAARTVTTAELLAVWVASLAGNLAGSLGFAWLVHAGGTLATPAVNGAPNPGGGMIAALVRAKDAATGPQLFWRSVLCNMLVCLALWMAIRTRSDSAKLIVLWWALLAFIASGFEHSVANMTIFALGVLGEVATWSQLARNLAWTVPGNIVGGGLLVGLVYAWIGRTAPALAGASLSGTQAVEMNLAGPGQNGATGEVAQAGSRPRS